jgi:uncharacterized protein with von Willebrand factor type A (vWA) domain
MPRQSYGKQIEDSNVMLAGIRSHKDKLEVRGINDQYLEKFTALNKNCIDTNNQQEKAKADLKSLTETLTGLLKELEKEMQFCKRVVMTEIPKSLWKEFGIQFRIRREKPDEETEDNQKNGS